MKIIKSYLTENPCYKEKRKIKVKGLILHSVGCPQPSAKVFVKNWNNKYFDAACVHAFIEADGDVYQTLPWEHRGWHAGGSANNTHIGVEMCEPSTIRYTGGASWKELSDGRNTKNDVLGTYKTAVELFAYLCKLYGLNPLKKGVILSHKEAAAMGIASNHGDPEHLWKKYGLTMDKFRKDVNATLKAPVSKPADLYRVQVGAYQRKENAEKMLAKVKKAGFDTYMVKENNLYHVQVGAYREKENAENMMKKLKAKSFEVFLTK